MNFLKKFGTIVLKVAGVASTAFPIFAPFAARFVPASAQGTVMAGLDKLDAAATAVITAEQMFAASGLQVAGSDKLKAVTPFIAALVKDIAHVSGKQPKDEAKFEAAITQITSSLADALTSYE